MKKAAADIKRPVLADSTSQICAAVHPAAQCLRDDLKVAINRLFSQLGGAAEHNM